MAKASLGALPDVPRPKESIPREYWFGPWTRRGIISSRLFSSDEVIRMGAAFAELKLESRKSVREFFLRPLWN